VSGQFHAPAALPLGKSPQFTLGKNLDELQSPSGRFGEKENILPLSGFDPRFLGRPGAVLHCYHIIQNGVLSLALFIAASVKRVPVLDVCDIGMISTCVRMSAKVWDFNFVMRSEHFVVTGKFINC
jgi:hypothetical protein